MATHWTYATGLVWFGRFYGRVVTRQNARSATTHRRGGTDGRPNHTGEPWPAGGASRPFIHSAERVGRP